MPQKPGVYLFLDKKNEVLYVGKAKSLKNRVSSYFNKSAVFPRKTRLLVAKIDKIKIIIVNSEIEALLLEANLIKKNKPIYNSRFTYGKSYPLIKITKETYPKVLFARKVNVEVLNDNALYFGPYPDAGALRLVLKTIRKIFPFQSADNHPKRICLYNHLGLCPCPPVFDSKDFKHEYQKDINHIIKFLKGNIKGVLKDLRKERDKESKIENFEKAKKIQDKVKAIISITTSVRSPFDYEKNPHLIETVRLRETIELHRILQESGVVVSKLEKIECFDISNISGTFAVGSMVVFVNGEEEKSLYRRFRCHSLSNDYAMIAEVLKRRLRHNEWGDYPDLIIVDGGKGQVSSALKTLKESNLSIPAIGLAKREEVIIIPTRSILVEASKEYPCKEKVYFKEIRLPGSSKALHLVQRIRDEAHRFAITYHRKLRSSFLLNFILIRKIKK